MAVKKQSAKAVKKKWFNLIASPEFGKAFIGQTPVSDVQALKGRVVAVNMMALTKDPKKQNTTLKFRVNDISGSDANTELVKYELSSVFVKRLVKKAKDKIDDSFIIETKDKVRVRVKPLMLTRTMTNKRKLTALRLASRKLLAEIAKEKTYSELIIMMLRGELQKTIRMNLKKVYPLSSSEIRVFHKQKSGGQRHGNNI